jgi:shikimate kinase
MSTPVAILIGPPGAGKSTVGALLAARLGVSFTDTDTQIEATAGKPVSDIFISDGEPVFRDLERAAVADALASSDGVVAVGGGAVLDPQTQQLLAGQQVVYLETGFAAAAKRVGISQARPLLIGNPRATLKVLLDQRLPVYQRLAWLTVGTDERAVDEIADEIAARLTAGVSETRSASGADGSDGISGSDGINEAGGINGAGQ